MAAVDRVRILVVDKSQTKQCQSQQPDMALGFMLQIFQAFSDRISLDLSARRKDRQYRSICALGVLTVREFYDTGLDLHKTVFTSVISSIAIHCLGNCIEE